MNFTSDRQRRAVFSRLAGLSGDRQSGCGILSNRFSEQETDEDKKYIEILKKGGVVYITPPDSPEEFRKYEAEMRKKLERKKFAKDVKKQTILSPVYGKDELEARLPVDNEVIDPKSKQTHFGEEFKEGRRIDTGKLDEAKSVLNDWEYDVKDYDQSVLDEAKASLVSGDILKAKKAIDDQIIIHEAFPEDERTDRLREISRKLGDVIGSDRSRKKKKMKNLDYDNEYSRKSMNEFIKEHREEIDNATKSQYKNDEERRLWILNDEGLYNWARSEGVRI